MKKVIVLIILLFINSLVYSQNINLCVDSIGIAPFAVFFDAIDSTSGVIQPPLVNGRREYADQYYSWDYGDTCIGTWPNSDKLKNNDIGYIACHVYDNPGTYTTTLTVEDSQGNIEIYTQNIIVENPNVVFAGANTICLSSTGDFTGAPTGALHVTTTNILDLQNYVATGKRVLLKRGDSWTTSDKIYFSNVPGPVVIGAFGQGVNSDERGIYENAPLINLTGYESGSFLEYSNVNNWQIMDLHFVGDKSYHSSISGTLREIKNMLHYRLHFEGFSTPIGTSHWDTDGHDRWMLISSSVHDTKNYGVYTGSERLVIMGNLICDIDTSHVLRVWQAYKGVINHNILHGSSINSNMGRHAIKLHGPSEDLIFSTGDDHLDMRTSFVVLYDNIFGTSGPWPVAISPQDNYTDERLTNILVEANRFLSGYGSLSLYSSKVQISLYLRAGYATVRNNIFDGTGSAKYYTAASIVPTGYISSFDNRIYNNTIYKCDFPNDYCSYYGFKIKESCENNIIQNNIMQYDLPEPSVLLLIEDSGYNTTATHNIITDDSCFIDPSNQNPLLRDFNLISNSIAIDSGIIVSVFHDYALNHRPIGSAFDIGAFEYVNTAIEETLFNISNTNYCYNYPNPFKKFTTIEYMLVKPTEVELEIFSISGIKMESIYLGEQTQGIHSFTLDMKDYTPGIFFLKINTEYSEIIKKCILLK